MFIAVGGLCAGISGAMPPGALFGDLRRPYNTAQHRIRQINDAIGGLLLKIPRVSAVHISTRSVCESYLLMVRQYYKSALNTHDTALRSVLLLHASRLWRSYPSFSAEVGQVFANSGSSPAAYKALAKFQKASMNLNTMINTWESLQRFQGRLLTPLQPLAALSAPAGKTIVWPVIPPSATVTHAPVSKAIIEPISQTIASLPSVNIASRMRRVFAGILRQIQTQLQQDPTDSQAKRYYRIILKCLKLAEHLQQVSVLSLDVQKSFNHRLMLALLFFKDPRTRSGALQRMKFIGRVVSTMELISTAPVSRAEKDILDRRVHHIMTNLNQRQRVQKYVTELDAIRSFVRSAHAISRSVAQPVPQPYASAKARIVAACRTEITDVIDRLKSRVSVGDLHTAEMQLLEMASNLKRIERMPADAQQALLYHPRSPVGVKRNLARWAREIGVSPAIESDASRNVDRFNQALKLLADIHLQLLHLAPTKLLGELSAHRYVKLVSLFDASQRDIINSLSTMHPAPDRLVTQLREQMRLLRTVHRLGQLVSTASEVVKLNTWGPWYMDSAAQHLWIRQMSESVAHRFARDTGLKTSSDAWLRFRTAAPAIKTLYRAVTIIAPRLKADPKRWNTVYLLVTLPPPAHAIAGSQSNEFSQACVLISSAAANQSHGHFQAATELFRRANRILGAIAPSIR